MNPISKRLDGSIEPFQMADLEDPAPPFRLIQQLLSFDQVRGDGLFHQYITTGNQGILDDRKMLHRGNRDDRRIGLLEQKEVVGVGLGSGLLRQLFG